MSEDKPDLELAYKECLDDSMNANDFMDRVPVECG
jgi:hypothetical protein